MGVASICIIRSIEISTFLKKSYFVFFPQLWGLLSTIARRGVFVLLLRHFLQNCHIWYKKKNYGPDFLKIVDIWSDFVNHLVLVEANLMEA